MVVLWFIWVLCSVQENMISLSGQGFLHSRVTREELPHKLLLIAVFCWADIQSGLAHSSTNSPNSHCVCGHKGNFTPPYLKISIYRKLRDAEQHLKKLVDVDADENINR